MTALARLVLEIKWIKIYALINRHKKVSTYPFKDDSPTLNMHIFADIGLPEAVIIGLFLNNWGDLAPVVAQRLDCSGILP